MNIISSKDVWGKKKSKSTDVRKRTVKSYPEGSSKHTNIYSETDSNDTIEECGKEEQRGQYIN